MINDEKVSEIIRKRIEMHPDDPGVLDKWKELVEIFTESEEDTIEYLESCSENNIRWISEIFEDISEIFKSLKFIKCAENLNKKFADLDLEEDIKYAKRSFN